MIVWDTSVAIEVMKKGVRTRKILDITGNDVITTSVTLHELLVGNSLVKESLGLAQILPFSEESAFHSAAVARFLRSQGKIINRFDLLIAGICLI